MASCKFLFQRFFQLSGPPESSFVNCRKSLFQLFLPLPRRATFRFPKSNCFNCLLTLRRFFQLYFNLQGLLQVTFPTFVQLSGPPESYFLNFLDGTTPRHRPSVTTAPSYGIALRAARTHFSGHRRRVRSVLRFSFACGLRPHAKLNPRTPLTPTSPMPLYLFFSRLQLH